MTCLWILLLPAAAYLSGSVNYAIIVTRVVKGQDIRSLGNRNPGTANVGRSVGRGWAALVFLFDTAKGIAPMIVTRTVFFPQRTVWSYFVVAAVGMAAIAGHCRSVFLRFHGGGGIATSIGVYGFFVPAELLICLVAAFLIAVLFVKRIRFRVGQGVPILFVPMIPFVTLGLNFVVDLPLFAGRSLGGHPWPVLVITFGLSVFIMLMNLSFLSRLFGRDGTHNTGNQTEQGLTDRELYSNNTIYS
jgi:acyl-phosphate glycerol 3-phosphate acyltransferase